MITKYIKIVVVLLSVVFFSACGKDFLELKPTTAISEDEVFQSFTNTQAALVGIYDQLGDPYFDGLFIPIMSDIMGEDLMINSVDNWSWFVEVYQLNILPNYVFAESPWWIGYKIIYDANKIIAKASSIPEVTPEQQHKLIGEAKVLRAYVMHKLVQIYAPAYSRDANALSILLATKTLEVEDDDLPRAPLSQVYEQIESDLLSAIDLLELEDDKGFFDKRAAQAILARVYLDKQEWEKARDMARSAYEDLELMDLNDWFSGFNYRNSETIFTLAYTSDDNNVYLSLPSFYYPAYGYSSMRVNDTFYTLFSISDSRKSLIQLEPDIDENRLLITKFQHYQAVGNAERICIRASEMYLIEAECEAELGNNSEAQSALFKIQSRANLSARKSTSTGQTLVDEVLLERRKELFGEGFRWNDIKRRQARFLREGDHWVKFDFDATDPDYYRLTFPIPQSEIDANTQISESDQNLGY